VADPPRPTRDSVVPPIEPNATEVGRDTVDGVTRKAKGWWRRNAAVGAERMQRVGAAQLAEKLRAQDPELLAHLAEIGVVRQAWLDDPSDGPAVRAARPLDVLVREIESRTERRPALLSRLGLGAVRLLTDLTASGPETATDGLVTVCFVDLEGFTPFTALEGDDQARRLLDRYYREVARIVRTRNGTTVKHIGDGQLLRFADPVDAVRAALDVVAADLGPLRVRAGLHRGPLLTEQGDVFGHTVNVAARVADSTRGGKVVVTADVRNAIGDVSGIELGRLKRMRLKGVAEKVEVCEVTRVRTQPAGG
jgi:class 3 adenylate cyclase